MNIEERRTLLAITAYGIHSSYHKIIEREIEKEFGIKSVYVYEYFLDTPFVRGSKSISPISCFYPFLLRILNEQRFIPEINEKINKYQDVRLLPFTFDNLWEFWSFNNKGSVVTNIKKYTFIGKKIFEAWLAKGKKSGNKGGWIEYLSPSGMVCGNFKFSISYLKEQYLRDIKKFNKTSYISALTEYLTVVYPWLSLGNNENLNIAAISLSATKIFYGGLFIFYPDTDTLKQPKGIFANPEGKESDSIKRLNKIIRNTYIPILLLYENFWQEKVLKDTLNHTPAWENCIFLNPALKDSDNDMEKAFYHLWTKRKEFYEQFSPGQEVTRKLEENLVFAKYLIASPGMLEELKNIVIPRDPSPRKGYLPSFLIIGGAGSGKDRMARVIPLFYPEYRFGRRYTINMAALKPDFLSVPLMSGSHIELISTNQNESKKTSELLLKGVFQKIWEEHKKEYPEAKDKKKRESIREKGLMPVVILDELNSLDIDAQGALLRFLENASLQPLGGIDDEDIDFLVIGIVNEPEDVLTLHEPLQKFLTEKAVFGGLFGKALYEYFRGMRRLREDVYYRLVREGKIRLPNLSDRRMDIPILFTFFLVDELPEKIGWKNLWIDFDVFEQLMKETIPWSGNFRELQSVAKRTAQFALSDLENQKVIRKGTFKKPFRVLYKHIEEVVKEFSWL